MGLTLGHRKWRLSKQSLINRNSPFPFHRNSGSFDSAIFAVTTIFSFIVMYDACHVRYYSGKNIELTQQLVKDLREMTGLRFDDPIYQEKLKNVLGHKFVEVIGGFVVGLIVPLILCPLFL